MAAVCDQEARGSAKVGKVKHYYISVGDFLHYISTK